MALLDSHSFQAPLHCDTFWLKQILFKTPQEESHTLFQDMYDNVKKNDLLISLLKFHTTRSLQCRSSKILEFNVGK